MLDYKEKVSSLKHEWAQLKAEYWEGIPEDEKNRLSILLNSLVDELQLQKNELRDKRSKILFPLSQSESPSDKLMGLIEVMSAILFFSSPRKEGELLENLENALSRKRFDYASTLIEHLVYEGNTSPRSGLIKNKIREFNGSTYSKLGLNQIEADIQKVDLWLNELSPLKIELTNQKQTNKVAAMNSK